MTTNYPDRINHFKGLLNQTIRSRLAATVGGFLLMGGAWALTVNSMSILTPHRYDATTAAQFDQQQQTRSLKLLMAIASLGMTGAAYFALKFARERGHWENSAKQLLWKGFMDYGEMLLKPPSPKEIDGFDLSLPGELPMLNLDGLINCPCLIIYGAQGSGKTTLAKQIGLKRQESGHSNVVLDPHGSASRWCGWKVVGSGMKYDAIAAALDNFNQTVARRYELYSEGQQDFDHLTFIADEFTNWAQRLPEETAGEYLKSCLSDIRKVAMHSIFIAHSNTLEIMGKAKGMAVMRDSGAIQIELFATMDASGEATPTGEGLVTYPGSEPMRVRIPQMVEVPPRDRLSLPPGGRLTSREDLERLYSTETADHPVDVDPKHVHQLYEWLRDKGRNHFENGVITARIIRRKFWTANNQKMSNEYINQLLNVLVRDGFGFWSNRTQGEFSLNVVDGGEDTSENP